MIGGLKIRSDDIVIDTSIQSRLKGIQKALLKHKITGAQYYEN